MLRARRAQRNEAPPQNGSGISTETVENPLGGAGGVSARRGARGMVLVLGCVSGEGRWWSLAAARGGCHLFAALLPLGWPFYQFACLTRLARVPAAFAGRHGNAGPSGRRRRAGNVRTEGARGGASSRRRGCPDGSGQDSVEQNPHERRARVSSLHLSRGGPFLLPRSPLTAPLTSRPFAGPCSSWLLWGRA